MTISIAFVLLTVGLSMLEFHIGPVHCCFSLLLVCMMTGTIFCNICDTSEELMDRVDNWTMPLNVLFFVISGAELDLKILAHPITILVGLLALTIYIFGSDALGGGSQVSLLMATGICVLIGMGVLRRPWAAFEEAMVRNISGVGTAIIILLIIGALSGAWVVSGVVPTLIYYGVQVIHPRPLPALHLHHLRHRVSDDR